MPSPENVVEADAPVVPGEGLDLQDAAVVADLFERAAEANLKSRRRSGSVITMGKRGRLLVTGDLHDHGLNFQRIIKLAQLPARKDRHLILHEVIHGPNRISGRDLSVRTMARVAALKLQFPTQVHILQSNHELAQLWGEGISKNGANSVLAFNEGLDFMFGDATDQVVAAMNTFIRSFALAVRCPNGVFVSHSLPAPKQMEYFDPAVLDREPTDKDLHRGGSAYNMVWGRHHTQELADTLASKWNSKVFVMGHQPAEMGYEIQGDTMLILASDHEHGMALPISLAKTYTRDELVAQLIPLASVTL